MTTRTHTAPPQRLALLPERDAAKHLTTAVLQGIEDLPHAAVEKTCVPLDDDPRWDAGPLHDLFDEAMDRFADKRTEADAWLAPRLHAMLRLSRKESADTRLWLFLAFRLAPDYVFWRNPLRPSKDDRSPQLNSAHFTGAFHKQTFARLWWAAELFRNGSDYRPVVTACGNQDVLNTVLRLEVIHHRATAQAVARLLESGTVRTGREVNALAQAINAAGSTLFFDALAPDEPRDPDAYRAWQEEAGGAFVQYESLPDGPDDGHVPDSTVDDLLPLFEKLFAEAPVRGQEAPSSVPS